jgi:hypothetical protein
MFVDNIGQAFTYDNGSFTTAVPVEGNVEFESVSCPTTSLCMAIDHNHKVFEYSGGIWDGGTTLDTGVRTYSNFVNVSCASATFCLALVGTSDGDLWYTWTGGANWSSASGPFDAAGGYAVSLTCTSTTFCLESDEIGDVSVFNGAGWSTPQNVDSYNATPQLYSSCVGKSCVAIDFYDNALSTSDATTGTWTTPAGIHADTGLAGVESLTCQSATLCVAGDGIGNASTYAIPPSPGTPVLAPSPTADVGQTLTLTHAGVQDPSVWYYDDWRSCDNPDAGCTFSPVSTSLTGYTLAASDAGKYLDAREFLGFGFDQEGPILSNIVGPIGTGGGGGGGRRAAPAERAAPVGQAGPRRGRRSCPARCPRRTRASSRCPWCARAARARARSSCWSRPPRSARGATRPPPGTRSRSPSS